MKPGSRIATALGAVVAGLLANAQPLQAAELSYGVDAGVGYSDNVARVDNDEAGETIATLGAQLRLDHASKRLTANVATRVEYRDYLDNTYDADVIGNLVANGALSIVEDRISWALTDTFGQTTQNQFAPVTPANRENVNYFATGPDFTLPLGSRNQLLLHGRYIDLHYENSDLGNYRLRGELAMRRDLSDATNLSLNVTKEETRFDDQSRFVDFDNDEAYLSYAIDAARTTLTFEGGASRITSGGESQGGWLGRVDIKRRTSPSLTLGLGLGHDFSDAGNAFVNQQSQQPGSVDPVPVQQTAAPFENTYATAFAQFSRNRTDLQLRVGYYKESYDGQPLFDRKRTTLDLAVNRNLNSSLSGHISANYSRQQYAELDREFADIIGTLGLRWNTGRSSFLKVDYQFVSRNDDSGGTDYRANEIWVRFAYLVGEDASAGSFGNP
jgi:hypothetical protein